MVEKLLSDCHQAQYRNDILSTEDLNQECICMGAECRFVGGQLVIDRGLRERIEECQVMWLHNYLLVIGNAVPNTQRRHKHSSTRYRSRGCAMMVENRSLSTAILSERQKLDPVEELAPPTPKLATIALDGLQEAAI